MDCVIHNHFVGSAATDDSGAVHRRSGHHTRRSALVVVAALTVVNTCIGAAEAEAIKLEVLTISEARKAGVSGAGCYWSDRTGGALRMAMADDRAVVRVNGAMLRLSKGAGAADLFPFTYDRWRAGGLMIRVVEDGHRRRKGRETDNVPSRLVVESAGGKFSVSGILVCGM